MRVADAAAVTRIYNGGIRERVATLETREREPAEVAAWLQDGLPVLVATGAGGEPLGFARVSAYSRRPVYAGVGEYGVYVAPAHRGHGLGRALLAALVAAATAAGMHKLTARILTSNAASLALARACGFTTVGIQRRHGRLDGEWQDLVLVERLFGPAGDDGPSARSSIPAV